MNTYDKFERAMDEAGYGFSAKNVIETHETIDNFVAARGEPQIEITESGVLHIWENVQQAKGLARGNLIAIDFGDTRFAHFDGQKI